MEKQFNPVNEALDYIHNKPIDCDETNFYLVIYNKIEDRNHRVARIIIYLVPERICNGENDYMFRIEKPFPADEKSIAEDLYNLLTVRDTSWRKGHNTRVNLINEESESSAQYKVYVSSSRLSINGIKSLIEKILNFIIANSEPLNLLTVVEDKNTGTRYKFINHNNKNNPIILEKDQSILYYRNGL